MKNQVYIIVLVFINYFAIVEGLTQSSNQLVPFYDGNSWGYCDSNLNIKIEPRFETAIPFYKGLGVVSIITLDTFITEESGYTDGDGNWKFNKKYFTYRNSHIGFINSLGEFVVKPFIGDYELGVNEIVLKYGHLVWNYNDISYDELGNEVYKTTYSAALEIDSSVVISYSGKILLPIKNGYYTFLSNTGIVHFSRKINLEMFPDQYFHLTNRVNFNDSIIPYLRCNDYVFWYETDTSLVMFDTTGSKKVDYNLLRMNNHSLHLPLLFNKLLFCSENEYEIIDSEGKTIEKSTLNFTDVEKMERSINKIVKEEWKLPLLDKYKFDGDYLIDFGTGSRMILMKVDTSGKNSYYFVLKSNLLDKIGPFDEASKFICGKSIVYSGDSVQIIDENGKLTKVNFKGNEISIYYWNSNLSNSPKFYNEYLLCTDKTDTATKCYYSVRDNKYFLRK